MRRQVPSSSVVTIAATIVLETAIEVVFGAAVIVAVLLAGRRLSAGAPSLSFGSSLVLGAAAALVVLAAALALRFRVRARTLLGRMARGFAVVASPRSFATGVLSWLAGALFMTKSRSG